MGYVAAAASIIGAGISAYGAYKQGQDSGDQQRLNMQLGQVSAADALQRGATQVGQIRTRGTQVQAQQHLAYANSGIDAQSGTPVDVMASTRMMSELDAATARNNAARAAWGYRTQGVQYAQQAALDQQNGNLRAAGTLLGGLGQAASYYRGGA